jgi:hypothetical protein
LWALHSAGAICWKKATSILRKRGEPFSLDVPGVETPYVFSEVFDLKPTSGLYPGSGVLVRSVGLQLPDRRISQPGFATTSSRIAGCWTGAIQRQPDDLRSAAPPTQGDHLSRQREPTLLPHSLRVEVGKTLRTLGGEGRSTGPDRYERTANRTVRPTERRSANHRYRPKPIVKSGIPHPQSCLKN